MKKILKFIALLPITLLSGCSKYVSSDFFKDYQWTRWISKDGNVEICVEGRANSYGYGRIKQISNNKCLICLDGSDSQHGFVYQGRTANTEISNDEEYILRVFNGEIDFTLKPIKILPEEVDLRYCDSNYFNKETFLRFDIFQGEYFQDNMTLQLYTKKEQKNIFLTISDNKHFTFKKDELIAKGTYSATYEDVTFNFDENQIFEGKENLVFEMV